MIPAIGWNGKTLTYLRIHGNCYGFYLGRPLLTNYPQFTVFLHPQAKCAHQNEVRGQ